MLRRILSISGKPGLYKLVSQGNNMLIVESLIDGKRMPTYNRDKVVSLGEIAMYTDESEKPLREVMQSIKEKYAGAKVDIDVKTAGMEILAPFMDSVMPDWDKDRVRKSDIGKLISWYNLLIASGNDNFEEEKPAGQPAAETPAEA